MRLRFRVVAYLLIGLVAAPASAAEKIAECCGRSANFVIEVDLQKKMLIRHQSRFFDERFCRKAEPENYGNVWIAFYENDREKIRIKMHLPMLSYFDEVSAEEKLSGGFIKLPTITMNLKLPECVKLSGSKVKIFDFSDNLVAEGRL